MADVVKQLALITIATSGVRVQFTASQIPTNTLVISASKSNTGNVYIGDITVSSTNGQELAPGESLEITARPSSKNNDDVILSDFYADTQTNGNTIRVMYTGRA
jgi:hypothetical protein